MRFIKKLKNFFRLRRRGFRKTGYYWVQWTFDHAGNPGRSWRIGWYNEMLEYWLLDGDERMYYDTDLLSINEIPIQRQLSLKPNVDWWFWLAEIIILVVLLYILSLN